MRMCRLNEGNIRIHRNAICRESTRVGNPGPNRFRGCERRDIFFVTVLISRGLTLVVLSNLLLDEESWTGHGGQNLVLLVSLGLVFVLAFLVLELLSELSELELFLLKLSLLFLLFQDFLTPLLALGAICQFGTTKRRTSDVQRRPLHPEYSHPAFP